MYKRSNLAWLKHVDFIFVDVLCVFFSIFVAHWIYTGSPNMFRTQLYTNATLMLVVLNVLLLVMFNTFHNVMRRGYYVELAQTVKHVLAVYAGLSVILFATKFGGVYSRVTVFLSAIIYFVSSYLTRLWWKQLVRSRLPLAPKKNMILVCAEADVARVVGRSEGLDEARFSGVVLTDRDAAGEKVEGLPVVANLDRAADYICRGWVDEVFFFPASIAELEITSAMPGNTDQLSIFEDEPQSVESTPAEIENPVARLLEQCRLMALPIHIRVPLGGMGEKSFVEKVNGFNVVTFTTNYASPLQLFLKRVVDILGGLVGSLVALLIMVFVGPKIKKLSPGPIIFKQERIGQNGKRFKVYKIRSMYMDAEERKKEFLAQNRVSDGMMFKLDFDPRIIGNEILPDGTKKTGIGEFIRSHSLDEFPQFFNVLKGEMSIVGTRPPTVDEWEKYQYHHRARLAFRPGVTGMWQTSGRSNITDFEEVVRLDTEYIEHWSLGLDLRLIVKTIRNMFTGEGAM